jgi:hypothetical protein
VLFLLNQNLQQMREAALDKQTQEVKQAMSMTVKSGNSNSSGLNNNQQIVYRQ